MDLNRTLSQGFMDTDSRVDKIYTRESEVLYLLSFYRYHKIQNSKMSTAIENGAGDSGQKQKTIEGIYQKKSQLEHILLRPDTYIGSVEPVTEVMWIFDKEKDMMVQKEIKYVPGLYKIFDEILVNAADNKQRDPKMDIIKIDIDS